MDPEGDLAEVIDRGRQAADDTAELASVLLELLRHRRLRRAQREREPDELLLRPIVQVALDPAPGRVGRGHDSCARGVHLGAALGVGNCRRDELREFRQPLFHVSRQRLGFA